MKYFILIIPLLLLLSCENNDNHSDFLIDLELKTYELNESKLLNIVERSNELGNPSWSLKTDTENLYKVNFLIHEERYEESMNYLKEVKSQKKDSLVTLLNNIENKTTKIKALTEISDLAFMMKDKLYHHFYPIRKLTPHAVLNKETYLPTDSIEITVYVHADYGGIIPIITFDKNNQDLNGIHEYDQKTMRHTELNNYEEGYGQTFKIYAGDILVDTIKGFFVIPDPKNGQDIYKFYLPHY